MAAAVEEQVSSKMHLCLQVLACRYASCTTQYILQCKTVKNLLASVEPTDEAVQYHRTILRGNRLASYLRQEKSFERIGTLGAGGYGTVELVKSNDSARYYALKTVIARAQQSVRKFHMLAMIERDCAIAMESPCFVKLKAAWIETNQEKGDCYKFLWENFCYGDLDGLIGQMHPMTSIDRKFSTACNDRSYFKFHNGTFREVMEGIDFEDMFHATNISLRLLFAENCIIEAAGKTRDYVHVVYLYLKQLLEGIRFLHSRNITHRDLKPGNILVADNLSLRIADLGLATLFEVSHMPSLHSWTLFEDMEDRPDDVSIALGGARERAQYIMDYLSQKDRLAPIGTKLWTGPEFESAFYKTPKYAPLKFNPMAYRLGDYYALGAITFQLLTGLHPIHHALRIYGAKLFTQNVHVESNHDHLVKVLPRQFNPLLHRKLTIEPSDFKKLFLDMRLHAVVVGLMDPDPRTRLDFAKMMQDPNYLSLSNEPFAHFPNPFSWNGWVRQRCQTPFSKCMRRYRQLGAPPPPVLEPGRSLPHLPGFPLVTSSPGMIGSPHAAPQPLLTSQMPSETPKSPERSPPKERKLPKGMRRCLVAKGTPPKPLQAW